MATGNKLNADMWSHPSLQDSSYHWPITHKPAPSDWGLWCTALTVALSLGCNNSLPILLGPWIHDMDQCQGWYLNPTGPYLLRLNENGWQTFTRIPHHTFTLTFLHTPQEASYIPNTTPLQVASIITNGNHITVTGWAPSIQHNQQNTQDWQTKLLQTEFATTWNLQLEIQGDPN